LSDLVSLEQGIKGFMN